MRYLAQFPAGTSPLVQAAIAASFEEIRVLRCDDSALVFESTSHIKSGKAAPFAKNVFLIHAETPRGPLEASVLSLSHRLRLPRAPSPRRGAGFRVMYHVDGQLVACGHKARAALQEAVAKATGLTLTPRGLVQEYWVIGRRHWPMLYFAERLPAVSSGKSRPKGALSSELSALLVAASEPRSRDVFLDPFAGSGAIVRARLRSPARQVIYNDIRLAAHRADVSDLTPPRCLVLTEDALVLPSVASGSVDVIVTDPPWGEFDDGLSNYSAFASDLAMSLTRVLNRKNGRAIVLVNRSNAVLITEALRTAGLRLGNAAEILVNGHPATVVKAAVK